MGTANEKEERCVQMKILYALLLTGMLTTGLTACGDTAAVPEEMKMKLQIQAGERILTATLYDNPATRALIVQLPLTLTLKDYNGTEKIADLPKKLPTTGAPDGFDPETGDIAYYAPWGNLAIFYRDFRYSQNLVLLGKIDGNGVAALQTANDLKVTFQRMEKPEEKKK